MRAVVLAIGGLDPGGGAGLAADVRAIHEGGAFAAPVASILTVQSTAGLVSATAVPAKLVRRMAEEVLRYENVRAIKVGALGSRENVRVVRDLVVASGLPLILDPVRVPTRGKARLANRGTFESIVTELFPRATVVTPNLPEAEAILGRRIRTLGEAEEAARDLLALGPRGVLLKGGHSNGASSTDFFAAGGSVAPLARKRRELPETHGGGCYFASLLAAEVAGVEGGLGPKEMKAAVGRARSRHARALFRSESVGGPLAVLIR